VNSSRPYLLRALYEWIVDNDCTPHVIVDATLPRCGRAAEYVKDGQIVLNLSPSAVIELQLGDDCVSFNGRFGGRPVDILFPSPRFSASTPARMGRGWPSSRRKRGTAPAMAAMVPPAASRRRPLRPGGKRPSLKVVK
jgi:stringent starvation protein B